MTDKHPRAGRILLLIAGFTAWSAAFVTLYGLQATGCRLGWHHSALAGGLILHRVVLVAVFLLFLAGMAGLTWWLFLRLRETRELRPQGAKVFIDSVSLHASIAALGATVFCFAGVFWLTAC